MKRFLLLSTLLGLFAGSTFAEQLAPKINPLPDEEIVQWIDKIRPHNEVDKNIIRRGLISDQLSLRAMCARYLATHGDTSDMPYLIDALSDESSHVGASYPVSGMSTTRYWANVALIAICKTSYDYRWDDPPEKRDYAISLWTQHWDRIEGQEPQ